MNYERPRLVASTAPSVRAIPPFGSWLIRRAKSIKATPGVGILLGAATATYGGLINLAHVTDPKRLLPVASGVQCAVIFGFIFMSRLLVVRGFTPHTAGDSGDRQALVKEVCSQCGGLGPEDLKRVMDNAARGLRHYQNYWMVLWLAWMLLYAVLTFMHLPGIVDDLSLGPALRVAATFLNNCAALALLYCYLTLSRPESLTAQGARGVRQADWPVWVTMLAMLTIAEAIMVAVVSAYKVNLPESFRVGPEQISSFFGWVSGIGSAVVMCFYTRRLASRFMDCPTWVIVLLYVYAALQPGFGVLGKANPWGTLLLLTFALLLKILLFFYMAYVYKYGWLLYYFVQVARFRDSASSRMQVFSQLLK